MQWALTTSSTHWFEEIVCTMWELLPTIFWWMMNLRCKKIWPVVVVVVVFFLPFCNLQSRLWNYLLICMCVDTMTKSQRSKGHGVVEEEEEEEEVGEGREGGEALADGWEWITAIVSGPSGQLWGSDPRPQPSILSPAAKSTSKTVMGYFLCSPSLSRLIHVIVIELCMPFMEEVWLLLSIAPASFFFSLLVLMALITSLSNFYSNL